MARMRQIEVKVTQIYTNVLNLGNFCQNFVRLFVNLDSIPRFCFGEITQKRDIQSPTFPVAF
jgi:hypothetical protein